MLIKISNSQHGPIALHPFRSDKDSVSTPLELREIAAARDFPGKITRTTLGHAKGTVLVYEISLQPLFELCFEEKMEQTKLLLMEKGTVTIQLSSEDKQWELTSGQCVVFRDINYTIFHSTATEMKFLVLEIDPLTEYLNWTAFEEGIYACSTQMKHHISTILNPPAILPLPGEWLTIQLLNVLMFLRQLIQLLQVEQPGRIAHLQYVLAADAYMLNNLHRNITIKEICKAVGLYETALKQAFTNHFGKGMIGRHQDLRIEKAKQLLQFTQKSIREIMVECGYGSENSFRQNFDNATGESPNLWRKKMKK